MTINISLEPNKDSHSTGRTPDIKLSKSSSGYLTLELQSPEREIEISGTELLDALIAMGFDT